MENQENNLLEHAVINQLETDLNDQEYNALSEMLSILILEDHPREVLIEYLSDSAKENWLESKTNCRY